MLVACRFLSGCRWLAKVRKRCDMQKRWCSPTTWQWLNAIESMETYRCREGWRRILHFINSKIQFKHSFLPLWKHMVNLGKAPTPLSEHSKRGGCSDSRSFSGWCTSGTQRGVDQMSRVCVSWLYQPPGKGCRPSGVTRG